MTSQQLQKSQHQPVSDLAKSKRASRLVKVNKNSPSTLTTESDPTTKISYRKQGGNNPVTYSDSWEFLQTILYYSLENAVQSLQIPGQY